jgi:hypothetical protein
MSNDLPNLLHEVGKVFNEYERELDLIAARCDPETKLAVTRWVLRAIVEHGKDPGSYRNLIYGHLGFDEAAYVPLCEYGMVISNEFDLTIKDRLQEVAKAEGYDKIKTIIGLCDEPGCYDYISCGWPSDDGYRSTCGKHYFGKMKSEK